MNLTGQIILLALATVLIITSLYYLYKNYLATSKWVKVKGIIIEFKMDNWGAIGADPSPHTYAPVVKYTTTDGEEITKESSMGSSVRIYEKGQEIDLYYDPDNKTDFVIKGKEAIINPLIFLLIGLALLGYYLYMPLSK